MGLIQRWRTKRARRSAEHARIEAILRDLAGDEPDLFDSREDFQDSIADALDAEDRDEQIRDLAAAAREWQLHEFERVTATLQHSRVFRARWWLASRTRQT